MKRGTEISVHSSRISRSGIVFGASPR